MGHPSLLRTTWISEAQESIPLRMVPQPMLILNGDTNLKHHVFLVCGLGDNASKESYFAYGGSYVGSRDINYCETLWRGDNKPIWWDGSYDRGIPFFG